MVQVKAADVQALRKATGAGMLDVKKALEEADGDPERAAQILRERGIVSAAKRSDRESSQGAVALSMIGERAGAMVELKCETDFVAKSQEFVNTANEIAAAVAEGGPEAVDGRRADRRRDDQEQDGASGRRQFLGDGGQVGDASLSAADVGGEVDAEEAGPAELGPQLVGVAAGADLLGEVGVPEAAGQFGHR